MERGLGDYSISSRPVSDFVGPYVRNYERRARSMEQFDDDSVPYASLATNTGIFAAAFGCRIHVYEGQETNAAARPLVRTAAEADRLGTPSLDAPTLSRILEIGRLLRRELGPEASIGVPDIQSPFDIAALIWNKEDLFPALLEEPEAVRRLVGKCQRLLVEFLTEFRRQIGEVNLCHCPYAWAPPELGVWLSEDEAGALSVRMFEEFCLPPLMEMSRAFGGIFVHCCAAADHQYPSFGKLSNLRGLNRVFQKPGAEPAVRAFSGQAVFMQAWQTVDDYLKLLDLSLPNTRWLFNLEGEMEKVRPEYERLRARCPRK
jgi:hypothetical protein